MRNNFTQETRDLFDMGGYAIDWEDGRNDADCIHHIMKRSSNSAYNAAPLNNIRTHQPEGRKGLPSIHSEITIRKFLNKTKRFLDEIGYQPNEEDLKFLQINKKYYDN